MPSLNRSHQFLNLKNKGQFIHVSHWLAVSVVSNEDKNLRWAWTISKKNGKAVIRNRLKRWGREALKKYGNENIDVNFIFKIKKREFYKELQHCEFDRTFSRAFQKIQKSL